MTETSIIIEKFNEQIDVEKDYTLKELKDILTMLYKKPKKIAKTVIMKNSEESDEDKPKKRGRPAIVKLDKDGNPKEKRAPSAYNKYVAKFIKERKEEYPEKGAKEMMSIAAGVWKTLSDEEKAEYK